MKLEDRFWNWATGSFIRLGTVLAVAHAIATAPMRKKARHG